MNDAGEIAVLFFLYGGGFAAALVSMLLATRQRQRVRQVLRYSFVAVLFLVGQAGCWHIATGIGRATGGSGSSTFSPVVPSSFGLWILWLVVLLLTSFRHSSRSVMPSTSHPPSTKRYDY
jgi:hypothetical protein